MHNAAEQAEVEEIAKAVGFAISEWGQLEHVLCSINAAAVRAPIYSLAHAAFYSIVSFQAKIKVLDAVFQMAFERDSSILEEWKALKKLARQLSEKRNGLAHGSIRIIYTNPKVVGWFPYWSGVEITKSYIVDGELMVAPDGIAVHYDSQEIREVTARFKMAAEMGHGLYEKICKRLHDEGRQWNHERLD
jgi:hypothetical protein